MKAKCLWELSKININGHPAGGGYVNKEHTFASDVFFDMDISLEQAEHLLTTLQYAIQFYKELDKSAEEECG